MKCFACRSENRNGVKFCEECGSEIALVCPRCDARIPIGKKFCGECGQKLAVGPKEKHPPSLDYNKPESYTPKFMAEKILTTRGSLEGERKLVTVFFCDVTGFTSLSENLDPESVHQIMDGCFKILMKEIHKFEGTINQFTGDGVMALFGAPIAHEDHAQRACYAAIAVQDTLAAYAASVKQDFSLDFKMRIGLNSGPVVVGAIGDDLRMDYTAVGDTTNLAARMEGLAEPGTILISENTYRLVNRFFRIESLGKVPVKGKSRPQAIYRLLGTGSIHSRLDASRARGLVEYIGRSEELADLQHILGGVAAGRGRVVGIVGEAGVGKSRFAYELHRHNGADGRFIESRCLQYSSNIPFLPILEWVRVYLDISRGTSEKEITARLTHGLEVLDKGLMNAINVFRDLLSLPVTDTRWEDLDPKEKRTRTFESIRDLFIRLSQDSSLILVIDDLQWMDKTSEEFLGYFIESIPNSRILLLLLYRQEYKHPWASKSFYAQIGLYPLPESDSSRFIRCILEDGDTAPEVEALIFERTSGNPLFMEELTYALLENQTIIKENTTYRLAGDKSAIRVPDTIQGIIAGRMDRLEDNIKLTMQTASVIGRSFIFRILKALTGMSDDIKDCLLELQSLELIYEKRIFPELEYTFKNVVTQEVAYNSLLKNRRRQIHGEIGHIFEALFSSQLEEFYEIMAHHFSKSDDAGAAFKYLRLSGDKAIRKNSAFEAFEFYKKALDILDRQPDGPEQKKSRLDLLHAMMSPIIMLNFPKESLAMLETGADLSKDLKDKKSLIRFYSNIGFYHSVKGRHRDGAKFSEKAFQQATQINDIRAMAQAAPDLCLSCFAAAKYDKVISIASTMIHAIQKSGKEKETFGGPAVVYPTFYTFTGLSQAHLGRFDKALENCTYGLEIAKGSDNLFTLSLCYYYQGFALLLKGSFSAAVPYFEACLNILEQVDFIQIEALAKCGLGVAVAFGKDPSKGVALAKDGLKAYQETGIKWQVSLLQYYLGICYFQLGDYPHALVLSEQALASAVKIHEPFHQGKALIWKGRIQGMIDPGSVAEAISVIRQGLDILKGLGTRPDIAVGEFFLGELKAGAGPADEAAAHLKAAVEAFEEMGMDYWPLQAEEKLKSIKLNP